MEVTLTGKNNSLGWRILGSLLERSQNPCLHNGRMAMAQGLYGALLKIERPCSFREDSQPLEDSSTINSK